MNILSATASHFRSLADKHAFDINQCVQNPTSDNPVEALAKSIRCYNEAVSALNTLSNISSQVNQTQTTDIPENTDES